MLLTDSIQIKQQGCGKAHHAFPVFRRACGEDQDVGWLLEASAKTTLDRAANAPAHRETGKRGCEGGVFDAIG